MKRINVIDSHTGGEPTRVIVGGGPDLGEGPLDQRVKKFRASFDHVRTGVINEPRGSEAWVGALLCEPHEPGCDHGVIFFNNDGYLGMCGHGTIGLVETLRFQGRLGPGTCRIDTPVGAVTAVLAENGAVTVENVPSYRFRAGVEVDVPDVGTVTGDIAYGGNWFFLVKSSPPSPLKFEYLATLHHVALAIREALEREGITGAGGARIDHVEFFGPPEDARNDSRNYVLCPGGAYDRSPCGTGTSAKLACLAAEGDLGAGETWRQESVIGSVFEARYAWPGGSRPETEPGTNPDPGPTIIPSITGRASVTAVSELVFDPRDLFPDGIGT
ncbi:MAG: proline racemase family protein [Planctomycetota bacterium]